MRAIRILLIENTRPNEVSFAAALKRKYQVQIAHSGKHALDLAQRLRPDIVILDAASLRTSGDRICIRLRDKLGELPLIHIRPAAGGESPADVVLCPPFTSRKLINRIERFVAAVQPAGELVEAGLFVLNLEKQTLTTPWTEKKLTPKLAALMELFLENPNQTLGRLEIMQKVWETDYMGDTRTLDVHIRWIREIVEPNPRKPRYIRTVRGIGYCFSPDEAEESNEVLPADKLSL